MRLLLAKPGPGFCHVIEQTGLRGGVGLPFQGQRVGIGAQAGLAAGQRALRDVVLELRRVHEYLAQSLSGGSAFPEGDFLL